MDLLLVDSGDRVDGNGLYDGSSPKGEYTYDIFKMQHIDLLCTGNHELYERDAAEREFTKTVPNFKGNYIASNLDIIDPETGSRVPLAQRYKRFTTKNQGIRVIAFGFLFDFTGNANNTFVQPVEKTIQEAWFQEAIREDVDIFVVLGHVDLRAPEFEAIYRSIRKQKLNTPIQFFGGHSHIRNFVKYDTKAHALQSGRYMETIGWLSIEGIHGHGEASHKVSEGDRELTFNRRYIDNNVIGYHFHTALNESTFPTELGQNVTKAILVARKEMNLDQKFGCTPQDYFLNRAEYTSNASIFSWLGEQVLPDILVREDRLKTPRLAIINTGVIRFDLLQGPFTRDTVYITSPFKNRFKFIKDVPYSAAKEVLTLLNGGSRIFESAGLQARRFSVPQQMAIRGDIVVGRESFEAYPNGAQAPLHLHDDHKPSLKPGYTTKDDAGDDGDDTMHSPISFYQLPNCVQSEIMFPHNRDPQTVDMVYLDFVEPWILLALRYLGQMYDLSDAGPYIGDSPFPQLLEGWVKEHWPGDC